MISARPIVRRALLPLVGIALAVAAWEATVLGYQLPAIVLPNAFNPDCALTSLNVPFRSL